MTVALPDIRAFRPFETASTADAPETFPKGRCCAMHDCDTRLSIYNPNETCWLCTVKLDRLVRLACAD